MPVPTTSRNDQARRTIRRYFEGSTNVLAYLSIAGGAMLLLIGLAGGSVWIGLIGLALGAVGIWMTSKRKAGTSDRQIDEWFAEDFAAHDVVSRAMELLRLPDLARDAVLLRGPASGDWVSGLVSGERLGEDGRIRSTPTMVTAILCSTSQIGIYQACLDHTTGNLANETIQEVFYQDVTSVVVQARSESLDVRAAKAGVQAMRLSATQRGAGVSRRKIAANLDRLKARFKSEIVADLLQRDVTKTYRLDFSDGGRVVVPVADGRSTGQANRELDQEAGDVTAQAMVGLREFVREKKRAFLHVEADLER